MTLSKYSFILAGMAVMSFTACAAKSEAAYYSSPIAFDGKSYCDSVDRTVPLAIPENIMRVLDGENEIGIAEALLTKAAMEIAHKSASAQDCYRKLENGEKIFSGVLDAQRKGLRKAGGYKKAKDKSLRPIQAEITRFWREDQSARGAYIGLSTDNKTDASFWAQRLATAHTTRIDGESRVYIASLLTDYDWIDTKRFGRKVSAHAWILVQHADDHPEFQADVLARMEPYLASGDLKPANYAYLWDRVAVNTGQLQRYGTQPTWECKDGNLELQPMEDPENVNQRRAEMNMVSVEKGLETMTQGVCR